MKPSQYISQANMDDEYDKLHAENKDFDKKLTNLVKMLDAQDGGLITISQVRDCLMGGNSEPMEHEADANCWCEPENVGDGVFVHKRKH